MKQILANISLITLTILVVFLSMGFNVSKMRCDESGSLYLGIEIPSCSEENTIVCVKDQEKVSCCMMEVEKSCCPETKDKSCAGSTENIHFDFETLITCFEFDFKETSIFLYSFFFYDKQYDLKKHQHYAWRIPLPKLYKPELAKIQSFLL